MKGKQIGLMIWMLLIASFISAQSNAVPQPLVDLINKAIENYPKLKEGEAYIKMSEEKNKLAKAVYIPDIDGNASYRYAKPTPSISFPVGGQLETFSFIPANNYDMHLGLRQSIWDFGRTQANVKKTLAEIQTSKDNLESAKQTLAYQVAQLYYGIVFLNKSIDVQTGQVKLLAENEKIISDKLREGDALKFDLLSTQVKKNNAQNILIDLQANLEKQYELLNMLTGAQGAGYITQKEVNRNEINNDGISIENNYDIIIQNDILKSSAWDIKAAKRQWLPSLTGQARVGYQNGFVPNVNKLLFAYSAGVGLEIPISGWMRPNYMSRMNQLNLQAATYNLEAKKLSLNKDILQTHSDIEASESKLKNYELQVEQAKEALNLANVRYRNGIITNLEMLTAQTNLQDAQLGEIQLEYNLLLSRLQLSKLGGAKFW